MGGRWGAAIRPEFNRPFALETPSTNFLKNYVSHLARFSKLTSNIFYIHFETCKRCDFWHLVNIYILK